MLGSSGQVREPCPRTGGQVVDHRDVHRRASSSIVGCHQYINEEAEQEPSAASHENACAGQPGEVCSHPLEHLLHVDPHDLGDSKTELGLGHGAWVDCAAPDRHGAHR